MSLLVVLLLVFTSVCIFTPVAQSDEDKEVKSGRWEANELKEEELDDQEEVFLSDSASIVGCFKSSYAMELPAVVDLVCLPKGI